MRRRRSALIAALTVALLGMGTASAAEESADPKAAEPKSSATVGIRTANAQGGDDRGVFEYEVLPRGVVHDWIAVSNYRYRPITVRLFAKDATTTQDSPFAVQRSDETPSDVGAWVALKRNKITLPPRREVVIPFQLGVPYNATPGDHAGAIVVSLLAEEPQPEGGAIIVDHRVGMRIHLRVPGDLKPQLEVENLSVDWDGEDDVLGRGDATVTYTVRNTGNVRMSATGNIVLTRVLGLPAVSDDVAPIKDILPGGAATYTHTFENVVGTTRMTAQLTLDSEPIDPALPDAEDVRVSATFWVWPWLLIAELLGLILLLGAGGWYERRRRRTRRAGEPDAPNQGTEPEKEKAGVLVRSLLVGLVALGALVTASPADAAAGDKWWAKVRPTQGTADFALDIHTSGGCPSPATNVVGFMYGHGFPKEGAIVVSNTSADVTNEAGFVMPMLDSLRAIMLAQPDPQPFKGVYNIVLRCIEAEWPDRSLGEYVVAIRFSDNNTWKVEPPITRELGPVSAAPSSGENGEPLPGVGADPSAGTGSGTGEPGQVGTAPDPGAATDGSQERAEELLNGAGAPGVADQGAPSWPFAVAGIAVLIGVGLLLFGNRIPGPWRRS